MSKEFKTVKIPFHNSAMCHSIVNVLDIFRVFDQYSYTTKMLVRFKVVCVCSRLLLSRPHQFSSLPYLHTEQRENLDLGIPGIERIIGSYYSRRIR